jgi:hemerythrin
MAGTVFFQWTDSMSVKSQEIDQQHKQLVSLLNELYQAFMDKEHKEKIGVIIDKMADYTKYHFDTEERYFAAFAYDGRAMHILEHENFRNKVNEFKQKYKANSGALTFEVVNFLRTWLTGHIMETDRKYITCFSRNGIK